MTGINPRFFCTLPGLNHRLSASIHPPKRSFCSLLWCWLPTGWLGLLLVSAQVMAQTTTLNPFTSDGCSGFPNGTPAQHSLWLGCCTAHDFAYWKGGTFDERLNADLALRECVEAVGEPKVAALMLAGVRVGGSPYFPTRFRWGYGWPWPRDYGPLNPQELQQVAQMAAHYLSSAAALDTQERLP